MGECSVSLEPGIYPCATEAALSEAGLTDYASPLRQEYYLGMGRKGDAKKSQKARGQRLGA